MKEITRSKKIIFKKYILSLIRMIVLYSIFSITSYAKEDYIETIVNNFPLRTNDSDSTVMANEWLITTATSKNGNVKTISLDDTVHTVIEYKGMNEKEVITFATPFLNNYEGSVSQASGIATLINCMELVNQHYIEDKLPCTVQFVFLKEESITTMESYFSTMQQNGINVLSVIEISNVALGDKLFLYQSNIKANMSVYDELRKIATRNGISLSEIPSFLIGSQAEEEVLFDTTSTIPMLKIQSTKWCEANRTGGDSTTNQTIYYETADRNSENGRVTGTKYDNLQKLSEQQKEQMKKNRIDLERLLKKYFDSLSSIYSFDEVINEGESNQNVIESEQDVVSSSAVNEIETVIDTIEQSTEDRKEENHIKESITTQEDKSVEMSKEEKESGYQNEKNNDEEMVEEKNNSGFISMIIFIMVVMLMLGVLAFIWFILPVILKRKNEEK